MNTQPEDNTKPETLRLTEWLETSPNTRDKKAAAELRRLHEVNQELVEALEFAQAIIGHPDDAGSKFIAATIAKARGTE